MYLPQLTTARWSVKTPRRLAVVVRTTRDQVIIGNTTWSATMLAYVYKISRAGLVAGVEPVKTVFVIIC